MRESTRTFPSPAAACHLLLGLALALGSWGTSARSRLHVRGISWTRFDPAALGRSFNPRCLPEDQSHRTMSSRGLTGFGPLLGLTLLRYRLGCLRAVAHVSPFTVAGVSIDRPRVEPEPSANAKQRSSAHLCGALALACTGPQHDRPRTARWPMPSHGGRTSKHSTTVRDGRVRIGRQAGTPCHLSQTQRGIGRRSSLEIGNESPCVCMPATSRERA